MSDDLWRTEAACRGGDLNVFFPVRDDENESGGYYSEARKICARCPVSAACLDWAIANGQTQFGMLGGTTPVERRKIARERRLRRRGKAA